jgi:hypothetical protein
MRLPFLKAVVFVFALKLALTKTMSGGDLRDFRGG